MATTQPHIGKRALDGIRILDLTDETAVYSTRILADLGADVSRVEHPTNEPMRLYPPLDAETGQSMFHLFMNVNKDIVTLDLDSASGRAALVRMLSEVDVVVETAGPEVWKRRGIDSAALRRDYPALVWCSVTPLGAGGPRSHWRADDLISQALGGLMRLSGAPDREPLRLFGNQTCYIAGLHAATAIMIAVLHAEATGQGQHIDVSVQECIAHTLENAIQFYDGEGQTRERSGGAKAEAGVGLFKCSDGLIYLYASAWMLQVSWQNMVLWMIECGVPGAESFHEEKWLDMAFRQSAEARETLRDGIERVTGSMTRKQFYERAQYRKILAAPLNTVPDLLEHSQLNYYDWYRLGPLGGDRFGTFTGPPVRLSETPASVRRYVVGGTAGNGMEG